MGKYGTTSLPLFFFCFFLLFFSSFSLNLFHSHFLTPKKKKKGTTISNALKKKKYREKLKKRVFNMYILFEKIGGCGESFVGVVKSL